MYLETCANCIYQLDNASKESKEEEARRKIEALNREEAERKKKENKESSTGAAAAQAKAEKAEAKRLAALRKADEKRAAKEKKEAEREAKRTQKQLEEQVKAAKKREAAEKQREADEERRRVEKERQEERRIQKQQEQEAKRREAEQNTWSRLSDKEKRKKAEAIALAEVAAWQAKEDQEADNRLAAVKSQKDRLSTDFTPERAAAAVERSSSVRRPLSARTGNTSGAADQNSVARAPSVLTADTKVKRSKSTRSNWSAAEKGKGRAADEDVPPIPEGSAVNAVALPAAASNVSIAESAGRTPSISRKSVRSVHQEDGTVMHINPTRGPGKPAPAEQWRKPEEATPAII